MKLDGCSQKADLLISNVEKVIKGKNEQTTLAIIALLAGGHLLIEDIPGVGKTMLAKALASSLDAGFKRIQCTPDILPSDITGSMVYDGKSGFYFAPGPIFTNILLADEINRATPRTQSALLEAMDEFGVSIDGETKPLPLPFFVIATLNPMEHHGTFPLPEGQLDRFIMRISLGYPDAQTEKTIVMDNILSSPIENLTAVMNSEDIMEMRAIIGQVHVADEVLSYAQQIIEKTRGDERIFIGASPRATIGLIKASQAKAVIEKRDFITPDDVKYLAKYVLAHRIHTDTGTESPERIIEQILLEVSVSI
jgi:MoxR-like ATPase